MNIILIKSTNVYKNFFLDYKLNINVIYSYTNVCKTYLYIVQMNINLICTLYKNISTQNLV